MDDPTNIIKTSSTSPITAVNDEDVNATSLTFTQALQTVTEPEVSYRSYSGYRPVDEMQATYFLLCYIR